MNKVQDRKAYRIEERWGTANDYAVHFADEYDDRGEALGYFHFLAHHARASHPQDDFRPGSGKSLVLLGPDHTTLPGGAR